MFYFLGRIEAFHLHATLAHRTGTPPTDDDRRALRATCKDLRNVTSIFMTTLPQAWMMSLPTAQTGLLASCWTVGQDQQGS